VSNESCVIWIWGRVIWGCRKNLSSLVIWHGGSAPNKTKKTLLILRPSKPPSILSPQTANYYSNKRWCCGDMYHLDMSVWAFEKLAQTKWGVIAIESRDVPCWYKPKTAARLPYVSLGYFVWVGVFVCVE
jgi:hypothetical protein